MPEIPIRRAEVRDFPAVCALLTALGRPAVAPENERVLRNLYERYLFRRDTEPLVAEVDGRVAGFLSLEFRDRLSRERPQAWIPELIVGAAYRGRGLGKALLLRAIELARERPCWSVKLESRSHQKVAHRLYRSIGMQEVGAYFLLEF